MPHAFVTSGYVEGGALHVRNTSLLKETVSAWRDGEVVVTIEPKHATRSPSQNAWYWSCIVQTISEATGYTPDETHDLLKAMFLPKKLAITDGNGEIVAEFVLGGSTTRLDKIAFGEYCEAIRRWAAETLLIEIPDPDPRYQEAFA